jgi:hypothetical protein
VNSGLILLIYALSDGQWHLARGPATLVIGVALVGAFLLWQFKSAHPVVHPSWWLRRNFAAAFAIVGLQYAQFMDYIYVATLMFQDAFGYTAIQTALYYLPMSLVAFVVGNSVGFITPHVGVHALLIIGSVICLGAHALAHCFTLMNLVSRNSSSQCISYTEPAYRFSTSEDTML